MTSFLLALISLYAVQGTPPPLVDAESYAVYAAILPHEWPAKIEGQTSRDR